MSESTRRRRRPVTLETAADRLVERAFPHGWDADEDRETVAAMRAAFIAWVGERYPDLPLRSRDDVDALVIEYQQEAAVEKSRRLLRATVSREQPRPDRGSLRNVEAYRLGLVQARRIRSDLLGDVAPLSRDAAVRWIADQAAGHQQQAEVTVTYRLEEDRVSRTTRVGLMRAGVTHSLPDLAAVLERAQAIPTNVVMHGAHRRSLRVPELGEGSVPMNAGGLLDLADAIDRGSLSLVDLCGGFEAAVWFVLCGDWQPAGVRVTLRWTPTPETGGITLDVGELETTPGEVKAIYDKARQRHREMAGASPRRGLPMTRAQEVLACVALDVRADYPHLERGFTAEVFRRWLVQAQSHGVAVEAYRSVDAVQRSLRRVEARLGRLILTPGR